MIWASICLGIILGLIAGSFTGFIACLVTCVFFGYFFSQLLSSVQQTRKTQESDVVQHLERKVISLQQQINEITGRLKTLEQRHEHGNDAPLTREMYHEAGLPVLKPEDHIPAMTVPESLHSSGHFSSENLPPFIVQSEVLHSQDNSHQDVKSSQVVINSAGVLPAQAESINVFTQSSTPLSGSDSGTYGVRKHGTDDLKYHNVLPSDVPCEPTWFEEVWQRWVIGGNPMVKIGVLILFLGLSFLLRYVAEHAILPIEFRYAGVAATGVGLLIFGSRWRDREDNYGLILQGSGVGVLYLTTLAAMKLHPLIPYQFGFVILIVIAGYAAVLAILQNALALAVAGTLGGFAAPILASNGGEHHIAFFSYLVILNLSIVVVAWFKTWRLLNVMGFVCTFVLGTVWASQHYDATLFSTTEPFVFLFFVLYVVITFLFARRKLKEVPESDETYFRHEMAHIDYVDGFLAFGVPLATFGWQYLLVNNTEYGAAFSALGFGFIYVVLTFVLFQQSGKRYTLLTETLLALGVIFGSLAIPLGLEHAWTSAAWAIEAAGMYWLGIRQARVSARLFALLLLGGSALYFVHELHWGGVESVLGGSWLGCLILAISAGFVFWQMREASPEDLHAFEKNIRPHIVRSSAFFIGLIPFLLWQMEWAAPIFACLSALMVYCAFRLPAYPLLSWGITGQAVSGILFLGTLHSTIDGSVLARGWVGLLEVSIVGMSLLASVYVGVNQQADRLQRADGNITWGGVTTAGLLVGLVFINLAPLFVLSLRFAALVWPLIGVVLLWWAQRVRHFGIILFALALQGISGFSFLHDAAFSTSYSHVDVVMLTPFLHSGFLGPLLISLAAFACARIFRLADRNTTAMLSWCAVGWSVLWWMLAWGREIVRVVPIEMTAAGLVGITFVSAWLSSMIACRWSWPQWGAVTLIYVPVLTVIAWTSPSIHPLAGWGMLAWPIALGMHVLLLRRQTSWVSREISGWAHVAGVWLFIVIVAIELRWHFAQWGDPGSTWPLLGWIVMPVAYLWGITRLCVRERWPVNTYEREYLTISAIPIVIYILCWVWGSNWISDGTASPLPYIPLLNPLEIAHGAALLGVMVWYLAKSQQNSTSDEISVMAVGVGGVTSLVVLTGMVMRTCHHWGGIPWSGSALFASTLIQTSLSIVWSIVAIGLMVSTNYNRLRKVWISGAILIAIVVVKLFLIELADHGSLARIVSFIVVGMLLLLVGYFAPLPPKEL